MGGLFPLKKKEKGGGASDTNIWYISLLTWFSPFVPSSFVWIIFPHKQNSLSASLYRECGLSIVGHKDAVFQGIEGSQGDGRFHQQTAVDVTDDDKNTLPDHFILEHSVSRIGGGLVNPRLMFQEEKG